jgi:hypothetical protein
MSLPIFEEMRRANADFYTANPLENLNDEQLVALAEQAGMTIEELRLHLTTPHIEMSCPLCGRPQTHLVGCKGCGGDAWGWEWEECYGEDAANRVRQRLREFLARAEGVTQNQVHQAVKHAYTWGGCQVCVECWHNTLPGEHFLTCPLNLAAERALNPGRRLPNVLLLAVLYEETALHLQEKRQAAGREWLEATWLRWVEHWNTAPEAERPAVAEWRAALLYAAFMDEPPETESPKEVGER